jgi:acyl-CoA reductase-like NAD-dependent aldehyde dehydrogenase
MPLLSVYLQKKVISSTSSGGVSVNDTMVHFANADLRFGGVGASGIGSYHGGSTAVVGNARCYRGAARELKRDSC